MLSCSWKGFRFSLWSSNHPTWHLKSSTAVPEIISPPALLTAPHTHQLYLVCCGRSRSGTHGRGRYWIGRWFNEPGEAQRWLFNSGQQLGSESSKYVDVTAGIPPDCGRGSPDNRTGTRRSKTPRHTCTDDKRICQGRSKGLRGFKSKQNMLPSPRESDREALTDTNWDVWGRSFTYSERITFILGRRTEVWVSL